MQLGISSYTFGWAVGSGMGSTGHWPVPSGDPPDGTGRTLVRTTRVHLPTTSSAIPGGESPTGTGGSPVLPQPLNEHGLLDKCRVLGVKLLQIGDNLPLHTFSDERLNKLADRAAREGVQLELGARRLTVERVTQYANIARALGSNLIRVVIDDADYHPTADEVIAVLRAVTPLLDGLTLGIENHDRFRAATLREMIESARSERIGVCLDTANSLGAGEGLDTVLRELAPLTVNLHIKDFHIQRVPYLMGFTVSGRPAGEGMLNIPALLEQLTRAQPRTTNHEQRTPTAILELWTPPEATLEETIAKESAWAVRSLEYLKPFFAL